jgi:hypothetical protein
MEGKNFKDPFEYSSSALVNFQGFERKHVKASLRTFYSQ